jgi:hypothetical protein
MQNLVKKNFYIYFILFTLLSNFILFHYYLNINFFKNSFFFNNENNYIFLIFKYLQFGQDLNEIKIFSNIDFQINLYNIQLLVLKIILYFTKDYVFAYKIYLLLVSNITFGISFFVLNKFTKDKILCFLFSYLFLYNSFFSQSIYQNIFFISFFSVPLICLMLFQLINADVINFKILEFKNLFYIFLITNSGFEFTFFFISILFFVLIYNKLSSIKLNNTFYVLLITLFFLVISLVISKYIFNNNFFILEKEEFYKYLEYNSLKIINLLIPNNNSYLDLFSLIREKYHNAMMYHIPVDGSKNYLGVLFILILLLSIINILIFNHNSSGKIKKFVSRFINIDYLNKLSYLIFCFILFSVIGGIAHILLTKIFLITNLSLSYLFILFFCILITIKIFNYFKIEKKKYYLFLITLVTLSTLDTTGFAKKPYNHNKIFLEPGTLILNSNNSVNQINFPNNFEIAKNLYMLNIEDIKLNLLYLDTQTVFDKNGYSSIYALNFYLKNFSDKINIVLINNKLLQSYRSELIFKPKKEIKINNEYSKLSFK